MIILRNYIIIWFLKIVKKRLTLYLLVSSAETFANSLEPDQARQNVALDLVPNCLTHYLVFLKEFLEKGDFEKSRQTTKQIMKKLPSRQ